VFNIRLLEGFGFFLNGRLDGRQGAREHKDVKVISLSIGEPNTEEAMDDMIKLDLSTDKSNFVKAEKVLLNVVPKYLRQLFKEQWNRKFPDQEWDSSHASRSLLLKKLSGRMNSATDFEKKLTNGNEQEWDAATLFYILLDSSLNLSTNVGMREDIKVLKGIDSAFSDDRSKMSISSEEFIETMDKIKSIARRIFNENAEKEVNDIEISPEERKMKIKLRQLLAKEKSRKRDTDQSAKILEKGYKAQIEFRPEEANFRTIEDLLLSVIPNHLRRFFKIRWDKEYQNHKWKSNSESGEFLVSELSYQIKTNTANTEINKLKTGNETDWGVATIANILLDSHLQLVTDSEEPKEGIETLIAIEKSFYEDKEKMECSFDDFKYFAGEIIVASKKVFDEIADDEINEILKAHEEKLKAVQDLVKYFELTVEEVNFVKITKIVLDVLPKYLRKCFIEHWNRKYSTNQWNSDEVSGQFLINELSASAKQYAEEVGYLEKLATGNENKWDTTTLVYVMLFSDLELVPKCRAKEERFPPLLISEKIDIIRYKINTAFAQAETMVCSSYEFRNIIAELKSAAKNIFDEGAEKEIDSIAMSQIRMQMSEATTRQLKEAIRISRKVEKAVKEVEGRVSSLEKKVHFIEEKAAKSITHPTIEVKSGGAVLIGDNTTANVNIAESDKPTDPVEFVELPVEAVNFFKITRILRDCLPQYLRKCFIKYWNRKYSDNQWNSDEASGQFLINEIRRKKKKPKEDVLERLSGGNEEKWDITTLAYVMLFSDLELVPKCRDKKDRFIPLHISEEIDIIREKRNDLAHAGAMAYSSDEFRDTVEKLKSAAKNIFEEGVEKEIDRIANYRIRIQISDATMTQVKEVKAVKDSLKSTYKSSYQTHRIHAVDEMKRIILKEVKITEFAVTLKLSHTLPSACTYKDEARQYLENLIGATSKKVDLSGLFDEDNRVIFVCGIAGVGKSVLAKQLACEWANDVMYTDFKLLIMFECRELNRFKSEERPDLNGLELIDEFLKKELHCTYEDGEKIMFVIDGLDELYDIDKDNSIIWGLLDGSNPRYSQCKFIVTGRPCVECNLVRHDNDVGGMRKVEIQGLSDEQLKVYVDKIALNEKDRSSIDKAMKSTKTTLPILHVPQFLNTFCCVAILTEGQKIHCKAELYTWTLYLLLKQHAEIEQLFENPAENVFRRFSKPLIALGEICHKLLIANTIIVKKRQSIWI